MTTHKQVSQSPEQLDKQIQFVKQRIGLRRVRVKGHVYQIKERTKKKLGSPVTLIGAALFGMALSRSNRRSGASLLQTLNLALLILNRLSVIAKAFAGSTPRKSAADDPIVPPGKTPEGSCPKQPSN